MRIDGGDGETSWMEVRLDEANEPDVMIGRDLSESFLQRDVNCRQHNLESRREERHRILVNAGAISEKIGLAVKIYANCFFVDRRGDDAGNVADKSC